MNLNYLILSYSNKLLQIRNRFKKTHLVFEVKEKP
jgi:hypothetical protein